jgi:hypothetical protein
MGQFTRELHESGVNRGDKVNAIEGPRRSLESCFRTRKPRRRHERYQNYASQKIPDPKAPELSNRGHTLSALLSREKKLDQMLEKPVKIEL